VAENGALFARGPNVMLGYWNNPEATAQVLSDDGWLNTGDQVNIDEHGFVTITGRLKEIIVMGNGEKIPPVDMELAIQLDPVFEQVLVFGEAKPYLSAIVVLNDDEWAKAAAEAKLDASLAINDGKAEKLLIQRITKRIKNFPGYAQVRKVTIAREKWTVDNGLMTPTLKLKRNVVFQKYAPAIDDMYKGHSL
jgi:long-chain acyl-CoA synthetase